MTKVLITSRNKGTTERPGYKFMGRIEKLEEVVARQLASLEALKNDMQRIPDGGGSRKKRKAGSYSKRNVKKIRKNEMKKAAAANVEGDGEVRNVTKAKVMKIKQFNMEIFLRRIFWLEVTVEQHSALIRELQADVDSEETRRDVAALQLGEGFEEKRSTIDNNPAPPINTTATHINTPSTPQIQEKRSAIDNNPTNPDTPAIYINTPSTPQLHRLTTRKFHPRAERHQAAISSGQLKDPPRAEQPSLINAAISSGQLKDPPRAEQPSLINRGIKGQEQGLGINQEAPNDIATSGLSRKELKKRKKKKRKKDALIKMMKTFYGDDSDSDSDSDSE
jgi:hypothetical protein